MKQHILQCFEMIELTYDALMLLGIWAVDIINTFVQALIHEKFYVECSPEFGSEYMGERIIMKRALYGMKSSGKDFMNHLRDCMDHVDCKSCLADLIHVIYLPHSSDLVLGLFDR